MDTPPPSPSGDVLFGTFSSDPSLTPLQRVRDGYARLSQVSSTSFEKYAQHHLHCLEAHSDGRVVFEILLTEQLCNDRNTLHAAAGTVILDCVTFASLGLVARPGFWAVPSAHVPEQCHLAAVTRTITTTWMRPAVLGAALRVTSELVNVSQRQAVIKCEAFDQATGKMIFWGSQDVLNIAENLEAFEKMAKSAKPNVSRVSKL